VQITTPNPSPQTSPVVLRRAIPTVAAHGFVMVISMPTKEGSFRGPGVFSRLAKASLISDHCREGVLSRSQNVGVLTKGGGLTLESRGGVSGTLWAWVAGVSRIQARLHLQQHGLACQGHKAQPRAGCWVGIWPSQMASGRGSSIGPVDQPERTDFVESWDDESRTGRTQTHSITHHRNDGSSLLRLLQQASQSACRSCPP